MNFEELKIKLRGDYSNIIIPLVKKDKCEMCGENNNLVVHHEEEFSLLLDKALKELNLYKLEFTKNECEIIKTYMLGKQIKINNITLCEECHKKVHKEKGGFSATGKLININAIRKEKRLQEKEHKEKLKREKYIKETLIPYLDNIFNNGLIFLTAKDRDSLIETIGLIDRHNSKIKEGNFVYVKNINSLNGYLEEVGSDYRIKQFETSRMIDGVKKKFKSAWRLVK